MKAYAVALSVSLLAASPALAVTAIGGGVATGTNVEVDNLSDNDQMISSFAGVPGPLAAISLSQVTFQGITTTASSYVFANWASANSGLIDFQWGWEAPGPAGVRTVVETNRVAEGWSYSFTTGANSARFNANWVTRVNDGSTFGLQGLYGVGGLPFNVTPFSLAPTAGSGSFFVDLAANTTYNFGIFNFGNLSSGNGLDSTVFSRVLLDWNIREQAGIPEPSAWVMMIAGFGLIGGLMRSRKTTMDFAKA